MTFTLRTSRVTTPAPSAVVASVPRLAARALPTGPPVVLISFTATMVVPRDLQIWSSVVFRALTATLLRVGVSLLQHNGDCTGRAQ